MKRKAGELFGAPTTVLTKDGVTVALPDGWKCYDDSILAWEFQSPAPSKSVAGSVVIFDWLESIVHFFIFP